MLLRVRARPRLEPTVFRLKLHLWASLAKPADRGSRVGGTGRCPGAYRVCAHTSPPTCRGRRQTGRQIPFNGRLGAQESKQMDGANGALGSPGVCPQGARVLSLFRRV